MSAPRASPAPLRIVSLLPSTTEIVCALGLGEFLVGRSHECDFPSAEVEGLPVCTRASLVDGDSRSIDDQVKRLVHDGLSIYDVDAALLRELAPTHILTQDQCEVCAASIDDLERALGDWIGERPHVVSLSPQTLGDVWNDIRTVGAALATHRGGSEINEAAEALSSELGDRLTTLGERSGSRPRPRVACIEWLDPLMAAGNWVPELVAIAGGENLLGTIGAHSPWLEWDTLCGAGPDILVLMPCGFDLERTAAEAASLHSHEAFATLRAVRAGRVAIVDGNAYFNRPGPRLADSAEILAEIFNADPAVPRPATETWRWLDIR